MPKRQDIQTVLIIGAGPIVIGQACEFDYSGVQAVKALKEEGYRVVLVNSNPATIMTDPELADRVYVEPITPEFVAKIIAQEKPDALLPTMGGQTALNCALALHRTGVLDAHGVELIGARAEAIEKAEDREKFRAAMESIGLESPKGRLCRSLDEAEAMLKEIDLPAIIRPSFTLGGTGGGAAYNIEEFREIALRGLDASPVREILVEESVLGWKEYEMEVVRDRADNCIIVCSIENVDPMGVHTGDSITVAPALTLTDKEYQRMRTASIACLREIGVETGGSNVQFAVDPKTGRMVVIEMNPRVSRSSALASKATGFPIAKIAAKLAVGYTLDELPNDVTGGATPASFEPTIDYVVTKIPRFAFEKFKGADDRLGTSMKSVGEAMAIGRTFCESLQKALRSLETGLSGLNAPALPGPDGAQDMDALRAALARPTADRLLIAAEALRRGLDASEISAIAGYDPWFVARLSDIVAAERVLQADGLPDGPDALRDLKAMGFSDARLAFLTGRREKEVTRLRRERGVRPAFKRIDSCAGEFDAATPYFYSTYERSAFDGVIDDETEPTDRRKVAILGGGPNRIGQGIEFDYCCCHAAFAARDADVESIMINCNPETVSTDYDTADRLYFEPLTAEDVSEILYAESRRGELAGVVVQLGGQTPLKLARDLEDDGFDILGTPPDAIDLAEDRERFQRLLDRLGLKQPRNAIARSRDEAITGAAIVGYPVLLRPSYVLGGRAMRVVHDDAELAEYVDQAVVVSGSNPVLIDAFLRDAVEVDVDAVSDGETVVIAGVLEHIEEAGVHSGDSACSMPPYTLSDSVVVELRAQTAQLAKALGVIGLMNVQFAIQGDDIYILEVNPRASRTVPFVAKAAGRPIAKIAMHAMLGRALTEEERAEPTPLGTAVKEVVFPFARFAGVDTVLGPEMRSTGEVMGLDVDFDRARAKSLIAAGVKVPTQGCVFVSVRDQDKETITEIAEKLIELGFSVVATGGTAEHLAALGVPVRRINKVLEGRPHIVDALKNGEIDLIFNTTEGAQSLKDSFSIRRTALAQKVPCITTLPGARAAVRAIQCLQADELQAKPLQAYGPTSNGAA